MANIVKKMFLALLLVVGSGCVSTLSPTFVQSMKEHRQDTVAVNLLLIQTFQAEMDNDERSEAKAAYQEIINNLLTISHQSEVLERYVWKSLTEEELALFLRSKWRINHELH